MVASFLESRTPGTLLVCHEGFPASAPFEFPGVRTYDLNRDPLLDEWLERNRDIIPDFLGGTAQECDCPNPAPFARHKSGCHWYWFNKNASKWFRKVVSLAYAARLDEPDQVVWVDADCVFKARLADDEIAGWFNGRSVFYLKSERATIESGVIGFRNTPEGRKFIEATVDHYRSGRFRSDLRWDDGYQFQATLERHPEISRVDLATTSNGDIFGHVVPNSPAGRYISHRKGVHGYLFGLMKVTTEPRQLPYNR